MKTIALYMVVGFSGIIFVTADEQGDLGCDYRAFLSTCCSNDIVYDIHNSNTIKKICSACIGRSCGPKCPQGYFGEQCNETCTCEADVCDDVFGCITTEKTSTFVDEKSTAPSSFDNSSNFELNEIQGLSNTFFPIFENKTPNEGPFKVVHLKTNEQQGNSTGMVLKLSLSASLFIIIVLLVVLLSVVYRARKNNTRYLTVSTERNASNVSPDNITRDSPVIYAAVVRPNKKPVRSVEQSDRMYGNMLTLQKPNRGRKRKPKTSKLHTSSNATNEEGVKHGSPATYSFVENPNTTLLLDVGNPYRASSLDKGHPDMALSLDVRHNGRTSSSDEGQYDQEYGNMTMC